MRQWGLEIVQVARAANTDARVFAMADPSGTAPDTNVALVHS
jgi:hypothetical protein